MLESMRMGSRSTRGAESFSDAPSFGEPTGYGPLRHTQAGGCLFIPIGGARGGARCAVAPKRAVGSSEPSAYERFHSTFQAAVTQESRGPSSARICAPPPRASRICPSIYRIPREATSRRKRPGRSRRWSTSSWRGGGSSEVDNLHVSRARSRGGRGGPGISPSRSPRGSATSPTRTSSSTRLEALVGDLSPPRASSTESPRRSTRRWSSSPRTMAGDPRPHRRRGTRTAPGGDPARGEDRARHQDAALAQHLAKEAAHLVPLMDGAFAPDEQTALVERFIASVPAAWVGPVLARGPTQGEQGLLRTLIAS